MGRSGFRVFLTLCMVAATLVGIIGLELHESALDEVAPPPAPAREQPDSLPLSSSSDVPVAEHMAAILARPLFSPSRRPPVVAAKGAASVLARLAGVIVSPEGKSAIFAGPANGKPIVVGEEGRIGEYVIRRIDVGAVTVAGPEGQRVLHPAFAPSPPPKPPPLVALGQGSVAQVR